MLYFLCGTPNLATIIPAMDHIDKVLTTSLDSDKYSIPIHASLTIGKHMLSKYYGKTGESEVYQITMSMLVPFLSLIYIFLTAIHLVLHPCHKLEYFKRNSWDEVSIKTAHNIVQDKFNRSYHLLDIEENQSTASTTQTNHDVTVCHSFANTYYTLTTICTDFHLVCTQKHVQGSSWVRFSRHHTLQNKPKNIQFGPELKEILNKQYLTHFWADFDDLGLIRKPTVSRNRTCDKP